MEARAISVLDGDSVPWWEETGFDPGHEVING